MDTLIFLAKSMGVWSQDFTYKSTSRKTWCLCLWLDCRVLCAASHWVSPSERYAVVPDETLSILANRLNQNASVSCDELFKKLCVLILFPHAKE